jgi:hypothetical protein
MACERRILRLQFSLRSLFGVMFVVAAWLGYTCHQHRQLGRDMQALRDLGCVFDVSPPNKYSIRRLLPAHSASGYQPSNGDLSSVRNYYRLGYASAERFIDIISRQPHLETVSVYGAELTDAQAKSVLELPLDALMLSDCSIGETLRATASPTLTWLGLARTRVDDHSLAALGDLPLVERLDLTRTRVSDRSIEYLAGRKSLKRVILRRCKVSREGADRLRRLRPDMKVDYEPLR